MDPTLVVGGGAWGTALAATLRRAGRAVVLWARSSEIVEAVNTRHENPVYLAGVPLDPAIRATADPAAAEEAALVLLVVPSQFLRGVARLLAPHVAAGVPVVLCAKGIETGSLKLMTEVAADALPGSPRAVLSGPTFAAEVVRGLPTAVTLATAEAALGARLADAVGSAMFRPYVSDDPVGAEIGGAVKNVLAIACGIVDGGGLGENARAALVTRGLAEMVRLARAKGGRAETLMGLSGLGDLVLTCTGQQSRNHALGVALGGGAALADALAARRSVVEGVASAAAVAALAARLGIAMPIVDAVDAILNRGAAIAPTVAGLLARPFRAELGG